MAGYTVSDTGLPDNRSATGNASSFPELDISIMQAMWDCKESSSKIELKDGVTYCPHQYDGILCWVTSPTETFASVKCPSAFEGLIVPDDIVATRYCNTTGLWEQTTNYSQCLDYLKDIKNSPDDADDKNKQLWMMVRDIYFFVSILSLLFLIVTLFIFSYFRALQCSRIAIHKNLVVSFIIRFIVIIVMIEPLVTGRESYRSIHWLCKAMHVLNQYTVLANIYWMFVEGMFLHNSIVVSVFSTEAPFKLFLFTGWGFPAIVVVTWAIVMRFFNENDCWEKYSQMPFIYIIIVPFLAALIINLLFLINIIRILVKKLRANNTMESDRIRKAIRATIVLMPLLGLTNILFVYNPEDGGSLQSAYHISNAVLQSMQGILVSVFYCFLNGEVRRVIKQKWYRFKIRRFLQAGGRRRSSRTSSFVLSQTETTQALATTHSGDADMGDISDLDSHVIHQVADSNTGNHVPLHVGNHVKSMDVSFDSDDVSNSKEIGDHMEEAYTDVLESLPPGNDDTISDIESAATDTATDGNTFDWTKLSNQPSTQHNGNCTVDWGPSSECSYEPLLNGHSEHGPWSVSESSDLSASAGTHNTDSPASSKPFYSSPSPRTSRHSTTPDHLGCNHTNEDWSKPDSSGYTDFSSDWDEIFAVCDTFNQDIRTETAK